VVDAIGWVAPLQRAPDFSLWRVVVARSGRQLEGRQRISPVLTKEWGRAQRTTISSVTYFTVDTQLFRELGELLVGRDSTALIELIKNAYDADAQQVVVFGERLTNAELGAIIVQDTGNGMTAEQFAKGFLRIASRSKQTDDRRSPVLGRRYTGEKGIGRLAAHKLARALDVLSVARGGQEQLDARIDWDRVETYETLDEVGEDGVHVATSPSTPDAAPGTTLRLAPLRRGWTEPQLAAFVAEVQTFEPPALLLDPLPDYVAPAPLLFERLEPRDAGTVAPFRVHLEGDFDIGEAMWQELAQSMSWVVEIDAAPDGVRIATSPTKLGLQREGAARADGEMGHPDPENGPFFQGRILVHEGRQGTQRQRSFTRTVSGVRVYLEGFRVAPYGEPGNDCSTSTATTRSVRPGSCCRGRTSRHPRPLSIVKRSRACGTLHMSAQCSSRRPPPQT
jgi:hypothetical protein